MSLTDLMSNAGLAIYAEVGMVLFLLTFIAIAWWVMSPRNRGRWAADASIPLDDASPVTQPQRED
ncbi:MAG: cbb3-type cytochrome c oxidase subunit 3 [Gemmatimonadaceae bacterium]